MVQRREMRGGQVTDVDIIAHAGSVRRVVIGSEDRDLRAQADAGLGRDLDQVSEVLAPLARSPLGIGAGDVEIPEGHVIERPGRRDVAQHLLDHQLAVSVGIDRGGGRLLGDRHALGRAVDGGRGGEDDAPHAAVQTGAYQAVALDHVVEVVGVRVFDRLRHHDASGEMNDGPDPVVHQQRRDARGIPDISLRETYAVRHRLRARVREVVEHEDLVAGIDQAISRVRSDVARPTGQ